MNTIHSPYEWLYTPQSRKLRVTLLAAVGIFSGVGVIRYFESIVLVNMAGLAYASLLGWTIPLSSLIWIFLNLLLRRPAQITNVSILFYLGAVVYWLYYQNEPVAMVDIVTKGDSIPSLLVFIGLLVATMSTVDRFLLSPFASKYILVTFFYLITDQILAVLIPNYITSKFQVFTVSITILLFFSAGWILLLEFLLLITNELFGKVYGRE